jgi:hypothetical protein
MSNDRPGARREKTERWVRVMRWVMRPHRHEETQHICAKAGVRAFIHHAGPAVRPLDRGRTQRTGRAGRRNVRASRLSHGNAGDDHCVMRR